MRPFASDSFAPTLLALALSLPGLASCAHQVASEPTRANTLSEAERARGVELLFDGKTTAGWRGYKQAGCPAGWQALDGALTRVAEAGDLATVDQYQDFVLDFEWRVSPGANSGVMFHVSEDHDAPYETGPEFQILDNVAHKDGLDPRTSAGSNYAMHGPIADVTHPAGEWNQARILVRGAHVEHWLNGRKVVEYELWSDDWKRDVQDCKWKDYPDYGQRKTGFIVLQDHGDRVSFRDLKLQRLQP